jgi:hypothetical protein
MPPTDRATARDARPVLSMARPPSERRATALGPLDELPPAPTDAEVEAMARKLGAQIRGTVDAE